MHMIADIFNCTPMSHNERFTEIWVHALPLGVDSDQVQHFPAAIHDVHDAEVEFAGHDCGVGFVGEGVEVLHGDGIYFVVDIEAMG
jgi:hypothetical protein